MKCNECEFYRFDVSGSFDDGSPDYRESACCEKMIDDAIAYGRMRFPGDSSLVYGDTDSCELFEEKKGA